MGRKGARRKADVPKPILRRLAMGEIETVNLMEWLAADMSALARAVAETLKSKSLARALRNASGKLSDAAITQRLQIAGSAIAATGIDFGGKAFAELSGHRSDLVRQWACYAVNDSARPMPLEFRLRSTLSFAVDTNMSVREAAWMAFRPHIQSDIRRALRVLEGVAASENAFCRRFAIEVSRPRSVWGQHIHVLKRQPEIAEALLDHVRSDAIRYVQLAVGNWINDAAKSRPDWALALCVRWMRASSTETRKIVNRGLRTLRAQRDRADPTLFPGAWPPSLLAAEMRRGGIHA